MIKGDVFVLLALLSNCAFVFSFAENRGEHHDVSSTTITHSNRHTVMSTTNMSRTPENFLPFSRPRPHPWIQSNMTEDTEVSMDGPAAQSYILVTLVGDWLATSIILEASCHGAFYLPVVIPPISTWSYIK